MNTYTKKKNIGEMKSKITKSVTIEENSKMKSITGKVASTCAKALISTPLWLSTFQAVKRLCLSDRICKGLQYDKDSKSYMLFDNFRFFRKTDGQE